MPIKLIAFITVLMTLSTTSFSKTEKHIPTDEDLMALETLGQFSVSPNGEYVLFVKRKSDLKKNIFLSQLWLADTKSGTSIQLTYGDKSIGEFGWLPNNDWLYFQRDKKTGFMRRSGGEARYLDIKEKGVRNLKFSDDGSLMTFIATPAKDKARDSRKEHFGDFEVVLADGTHQHLYTVKLTEEYKLDGKVSALTIGKEFSVFSYDLSPDGTTVAFNAASRPDLGALRSLDLYKVDVETKKVSILDNSDSLQGRPVFSPDGSKIAYSSSKGFAYNEVAYIIPVAGGKARSLAANFDENVIPDNWTKAGLYFLASNKTKRHVYLLNPKSEKVRRITKDRNAMVNRFDISDSGKTIIFSAASETRINELYVQQGRKLRRITNQSKQLDTLLVADRKIISWKAEDGTEIEGVLTTPKNFDVNKKYPLFVVTHGGPTAYDRPDLSRFSGLYPIDSWAGRGAIILQTNYRGSTGYGEAFRRLNWRNLGVGPATDIIAGVNSLVEKGFVDESKIGCLGWSQGGHISAMLATYSDRCTVAHMGAGISNWRTYYYNTDITLFTVEYFGKTPVEDDAVYQKTSPISYLDRAKTPVLIQHGENDRRVPLANAYELRQGLLDVGVEAPMVVYKGMPHGPRTPKTLRAVRSHINAWFSHHLFGDAKPDFTTDGVPEKKVKKDEDDASDSEDKDNLAVMSER